jgi:phosphate transport system substrate-binding protein
MPGQPPSKKEEPKQPEPDPTTTLRVAGDKAMVGLVEELAAAYRAEGSGVAVTVTALANGAGIVGASERRYDIGLSARDPIIGTDPSGLVFTKIAKEGMCIVTNPANAVANMSSETVDEIFTGGFTNWSQVAGSPIAGSIHVFDYEPQMPLQEAFESIFVEGGPPISASSTVETSEELLREAVSADTQAVGFVRVGQTGATNAVAHNSVPCTVKEAQSGQYGAERNLWTVTKGVPTGPAAVFTEWIRHSSRATALIESGWIALN